MKKYYIIKHEILTDEQVEECVQNLIEGFRLSNKPMCLDDGNDNWIYPEHIMSEEEMQERANRYRKELIELYDAYRTHKEPLYEIGMSDILEEENNESGLADRANYILEFYRWID